jgi:hypothetical protein
MPWHPKRISTLNISAKCWANWDRRIAKFMPQNILNTVIRFAINHVLPDKVGNGFCVDFLPHARSNRNRISALQVQRRTFELESWSLPCIP